MLGYVSGESVEILLRAISSNRFKAGTSLTIKRSAAMAGITQIMNGRDLALMHSVEVRKALGQR